MKKFNLKSGFTLVELMVFFIFISLLMAAATPIITKRVKDLPVKIQHGKFICYGGNYAYYNATKLVSSGAGCKFKPPKRATLYKIELVGGGAGGYEFTKWWEDTDEKTGGYKLSTGHYGHGYTDPTDGQLRYMLEDAKFTWATKSAGATSGKSVSLSYTGVGSPHITTTGACNGSCWTDHWGPCYTCTKTRTVQKETGTDEEGNPTYEDVEEDYEDSCCQDWITDNPEGLVLCSKCNALSSAMNSIASDITSKKTCEAGDQWCYTIATTDFISGYQASVASTAAGYDHEGVLRDFGSGNVGTGAPERGGYGLGMFVDGKIDFNFYNDGVKKVENAELRSYLRQLFGTFYAVGTTAVKGSCDGWGYFKTEKNKTDVGGHTLVGQNGDDIIHYNAIRGWGKCATNCTRAKGGRGGWIDDNSATISGSRATSAPIQEDKDAKGICAAVGGPYPVHEGNKSNSIPEITTKTILNVRHHQVGKGGSNGLYKYAYVASLEDDCIFNVSGGGPVITESISPSQITALENSLATSLTCNGGTLNIRVDGGKYDKNINPEDYSGFKFLSPSGESTAPATFTTSAAGGASAFSPHDVFTKYTLGAGYGAGGAGSTIKDGCTKPWGEYTINRVYGSSVDKSSGYQIPRTECDEKTQVTTVPATSGSAGVIIISW